MSAGLKPYPVYRDIGLPWLARLPERWSVKRGKELFRCIDERSASGAEELLTVSSSRGVVPRSTANVTMFKAESYVGYKLCWPGDLVINSLWAWAGGLGVSRHHGIISSAYGVYRLRDIARNSPAFVHELVRSVPFQWELQVRSKGIWTSRLQLTDQSFLEAPFPLPPADEQATIVRYLDFMDRRIRRYIRAKQELIKRLEEQKQTIVQSAVTRGFDPNVRLKASGVEWIGDVPEHWEVRRLRTLVRRIDQGVSPQAENRLADDGSWGVLKAGCVNGGVFREDQHKRLPNDFTIDPRIALRNGDVLVSRASGSPHLVGSVARVQALKLQLLLSDKTFRLAFREVVDPDFMVLAMNSRYYRQQVEQAISGAEGLANNLQLSSLRAFSFVVPPTTEQRRVAERVRAATSQLFAAVERAEREISLLGEYRIRLIADVVTGKLDVREAAASLPDDTDEPASLGDEDVLAEDGEARETADLGLAIEEVEA